jgi:hypothetical protein
MKHFLLAFLSFHLLFLCNVYSTPFPKCDLPATSDPVILKKLESLFVSNWLIAATTLTDQAEPVQTLFEFSVCNASTLCPANTLICKLTNAESNHKSKPDSVAFKSTTQIFKQPDGFLLNSTGSKCSTGGDDFNTSVYFRCGKTIGIPRLVSNKFADPCSFVFEWDTNEACETDKFKSSREVPCFLTSTDLDSSSRIQNYVTVDFNPLILAGTSSRPNSFESFHQVVEFNDDIDVGVNLCRYETTRKKDIFI